jgi:hypothetical protein
MSHEFLDPSRCPIGPRQPGIVWGVSLETILRLEREGYTKPVFVDWTGVPFFALRRATVDAHTMIGRVTVRPLSRTPSHGVT